jgi:hypothetical protein
MATTTVQIVTVNVTQTIAPAPNTLQRTGALVSQGATTITPGKVQLLTQLSDLTPLLVGAVSITSAVWTTGVVTLTTTTAHGIPSGDTATITVTGIQPSGYNGTFVGTSTGTNTLTYSLATNPGATTSLTGAVVTPEAVSDLVQMATTYFAQGPSVGVYVLELGYTTTPAAAITALNAYIESPVVQMYSYLIPTEMSLDSTFLAFAKNHDADNSSVYFWVTETISAYGVFTGVKSVVSTVQDVTAPSTEWTAAAMFAVTLNYNPSNTNMVTPTCFSYVYGVTAFTGTQTQQLALRNANVNYITTGAEGGITNTMVVWGVASDGNDFTYWYSVDWVQINVNLMISNAIINGSNNPINPLYYNQAGINTLQKVSQGVMNSGIAFGLVLGPVTVDAVPFTTYVTNNPSDYAIGKYAGLSVTYTPARGFTQIIFNVNVSSFALA